MATDNNGWNQLKRNNHSFMSDNFNVGDSVKVHDTVTFDRNGNVTGKPHSTFVVNGLSKSTKW